MKPLMIGISGLRGVIGGGLTPEVVARAAAAFGTLLGGGTVVMGRDSRVSGDFVRSAALSGLMSTGCTVTDVGICPTPTVQIWAEAFDGGVVLTASHNPQEWNGLKFIGGDGLFLDAGRTADLVRCYEEQMAAYVGWDRLGQVAFEPDPFLKHMERVEQLDLLDMDLLQQRRFKVVFDGCNASMSELGPGFLERMGCEVIALHCQPTGIFPRSPEPVPANLGDLCKAVVANGAEAGFAVDPDGDRLSLVSGDGVALGEEYTLALATQYVLSRRSGTVVINLSTSRMIEDIATAAGAAVERTPVGEINVAARLRDIKGVIGGEGNGGVILPQAHYGRDALVGMALILQAMAEGGASLSGLAEALPAYHMIKRTYALGAMEPGQMTAALAEHYAGASPDCSDGVRLSWPDRWVHVRRSNTEPIIRVVAEAPTRTGAEDLVRGTIEAMESLIQRRQGKPGKGR